MQLPSPSIAGGGGLGGMQQASAGVGGGGSHADESQGQQQAAVWLMTLGLQHCIAPLQQCSLLTMKQLRAADASLLMEAGCTADDAQVIAAAAAAAASAAAAA